MAAVRRLIRERDVVELISAVGRWPAGTTGRVVSDYGGVKLIEVGEERPPGQMLDLISVNEARLKLLAKYSD